MADMRKLVRELQDAEDDAGRNGHTFARHTRIIVATDAIRDEARARHHEYRTVKSPGYLFTITEDHVRDPTGTLGIRWFAVHECMGRLLKRDIGKRVFGRNGIFQVESDGQLAARTGRAVA